MQKIFLKSLINKEYKNVFNNKEYDLNKKIDLLESNKDNYDGLRIRINSTSREKVKIDYNIKIKSTLSNNLIRSRVSNDEKVISI